MRSLYSLIYGMALALVFPWEISKRPRGARMAWLKEKLGYVAPDKADGSSVPTLWVHAVSVGEVISAAYFIRAFREGHPAYRVVVSTITDTGRRVALQRLGDAAHVVYLPFDFGWTLKRAFGAVRPSLFVIMETELWPNLILTLGDMGTPVALVNGRISAKSHAGYSRVRPFLSGMLRGIGLYLMQDEVYADRAMSLGAPRENVRVAGNLKFDIHMEDRESPWVRSLPLPLLVAGSTHRGEDALVIEAYRELRDRHPGLSLVIAPRHPERAPEVEGILREKGMRYVLRSGIGEGRRALENIVVLDTVGELSSVYRACDVALIGGSFIPHGGQNPLEPAYWGRPVLCGPHMENFPFVRDLYEAGAAVETSAGGLVGDIDRLLMDRELARDLGERARGFLIGNQGAVLKTMDALKERFGI